MDKHNKREIVKNIAIVFLVIMLILTFFSNTIMNRTLPEVSTQMITNGTVSLQVRGEGTVETEDPYNVVIQETRKVKSVLKKEGDHVESGDVIYMLEGESGEELTTAKNELDGLKDEYELAKIDSGLTAAEVQTVEAGVTVNTGTILSVLEAKDNEIASLKSQLEDKEKRSSELDYQASLIENKSDTVDTSAEEAAVEAAEAAVENAEKILENANAVKDKYLEAIAAVETKNTAYENYVAAQEDYYGTPEKAGALEKYEKALGIYNEKKAAYDNLYDVYLKSVQDYEKKYEEMEATDPSDSSYADKVKAVTDAEQAKNEAWVNLTAPQKELAQYEVELNAAKTEMENALSTLTVAEQTLKEAEKLQVMVPTEEEMKKADEDIAAADWNVRDKQNALAAAKQKLAEKKNSGSSSSNKNKTDSDNIKKEQHEISVATTDLKAKIEKLEKEREDFLSAEKTKISLEKKYQDILKKEKDVKDLEAKAIGGEVTCPVTGTIISTNYSSGEKIEAGSTAAVVQIEGKGYKLSFPVSAKEARNVKVGDEVTVENSWYYGDMEVNLVAIQPDKNNSRDGKILVFSLSGESVQTGQNLTLSIGQKSSNYDFIVPLSALHEDTDGNFILIMQERNTPFGTRYIAKKVEAKVLAKDDKVAAIDAELLGYEYVITNSSRQLEKGDQVKLAEQ